MKAILLLALWAQDDKPNILFIFTDDHRPDALGCYGNESIRTPNFDRLAKEGARLDAFYVAAPLCCPSRAAMLTGLYPHQNGVMDNKGKPDLKKGAATIAELLNDAGYVTGFVGKAHMGGDPREWKFKETPVWLPSGGSKHRDPTLNVEGESKKVEGHITQIFADAAIGFLDKHKGDRFFLWLATTAPHTPYLRDPNHAYKKTDIKAPPMWPKGAELSDADWEGYYSTISMLDEQVGRVLKKLEETGLLDKTVIFMCGDNGFMHGSHGYRAKSVWYEESARVPALVRWPAKVKAGTTVAAPAVSVDFFATWCEIAGIEKPKDREGVSLLPALTGKEPLRAVAYSELGSAKMTWQMVRKGGWKYVKREDGTEMLYDLATDPNELKGAEAPKVLEEMRALHADFLKK